MTVFVLCAADPESTLLASDLELEGVTVRRSEPSALTASALHGVEALLIQPARTALTAELIGMCDRAGVRVVPVGTGDSRLLARFALPAPLPFSTPAAEVLTILGAAPRKVTSPSAIPARVITVWGSHGAPGRSTLAVQLAVELARTGRSTALVDADSVAPALALILGLGDEAPGLAAACRRADLGTLDAAELDRLAVPVETSGGTLDVLCGINRPQRWPELGAARLRTTLATCRAWVTETVVDVAADFDGHDDDADGAPLRHAATSSALLEADAVVAVLSANPLGVSRFLRGYAELRHLVGDTPVTVVANRVRPGPLGIDARGQVRRTLERFAGIDEVVFLPDDQRALDAAVLHARAPSDVAPRSAFVSGVRSLAAGLGARAEATAGSWRGSSRAARRLR